MKERTLLLVEDQFIIALAQQSDLECCGYIVLVADSEAMAIALCRAHPEIVLVLMDVDLGTDRDGIDAAEMILNEHDLPIVFLSSHTESEVVERAHRIPSYGYVAKGTGIKVLDAAIQIAQRRFAESQQVRKHSAKGA